MLNGVAAVLGAAILLAEIFAPAYTRIAFHNFSPESAALCTHLTRIILPAQFFFFAGGVLGSRLLVRKIFLYQAFGPLVYNLGIILGGVLLSQYVGIDSLAYGVLAGMVLGPAGFAAFGAYRNGWRYNFIFDLRHPVFREWLKAQALPLMMGVSLTYADKWILSYYASSVPGGISRLNVAKNLFNAPMSILGSAAGAASLPFFAALFAQGRASDFANAVNRSVSRVVATSLLAGAWMMALSEPLIGLFRGGRFSPADAADTSRYFTIFAVSIAMWSAQAIYSRSFLCGRQHTDSGNRGLVRYADLDPDLCAAVPEYGRNRTRCCFRYRHGDQHNYPGRSPAQVPSSFTSRVWSTRSWDGLSWPPCLPTPESSSACKSYIPQEDTKETSSQSLSAP